MSLGMILLVVLTLLILFGVLQRVLDRMALTDRQALFLVALIFVGGWLPDLRLGMVSLNIGGALVPFGAVSYTHLDVYKRQAYPSAESDWDFHVRRFPQFSGQTP